MDYSRKADPASSSVSANLIVRDRRVSADLLSYEM